METLAGVLGQTSSARIELDHARASQPDRPPARNAAALSRDADAPQVDLKKVMAWVVLTVVAGMVLWWIYIYLQTRFGAVLV
jgi:hypothetical protein